NHMGRSQPGNKRVKKSRGPQPARSLDRKRAARKESPGRAASSRTRPGSTRLPARAAEPLEDRRKRAERIIATLKTLYPEATCALHHRSAYELLISTILSAQSTDETVNKVTPVLFE